jgi:hypothetical protein
LTPSKAAGFETALLEALAGTARTEVVATELFDEFLIAVYDTQAAFHLRFGWEPLTAFAHPLESRGRRRIRGRLWYTAFRLNPVAMTGFELWRFGAESESSQGDGLANIEMAMKHKNSICTEEMISAGQANLTSVAVLSAMRLEPNAMGLPSMIRLGPSP